MIAPDVRHAVVTKCEMTWRTKCEMPWRTEFFRLQLKYDLCMIYVRLCREKLVIQHNNIGFRKIN